jgi:DNA polymerase III epsilon subunit-like protein
MSINNFRPRKYEDFEIINDQNRVVGHIRIKPSGVCWAPANSKKWHGISLEEFANFMEENGKVQKK